MYSLYYEYDLLACYKHRGRLLAYTYVTTLGGGPTDGRPPHEVSRPGGHVHLGSLDRKHRSAKSGQTLQTRTTNLVYRALKFP